MEQSLISSIHKLLGLISNIYNGLWSFQSLVFRPDLGHALVDLARHYASKDRWSEANLMIIFCPISAGNWLVSIIDPGGREGAVLANQRPVFTPRQPIRGQERATGIDHHQIWQINREWRIQVLPWPGALVSAIHLYTGHRVFMRKVRRGKIFGALLSFNVIDVPGTIPWSPFFDPWGIRRVWCQ